MNTQSETAIKHSDVINQIVLNRQNTEEIGRVAELWLDPIAHQVLGLVCKSGLLGRKKRSFTWVEIEAIGSDSILVYLDSETAAKKPPSVESIVGHQLWTDGGNQAGTLMDYRFDPQTGKVVEYIFGSKGWRGLTDGTYRLPPVAIASVGGKRVMAIETMVQNAEHYTGGINHKISQAAESLKDDYAKTKEDMAALVEGAQGLATQVQETTKKVAENTQEKLSDVAGQVQETTKKVAGNAQDKFSDVADQVQETTKKVAENTQNKFSEVAGQAQQTTKQLTGNAQQKLSDVTTQLQETPKKVAENSQNKFSEVAGQVQQSAKQLTGNTKEKLSEVTTQVQQTTKKVAENTQNKFSEVAGQAQQTTKQLTDQAQEKLVQVKTKLPSADSATTTEAADKDKTLKASSEPESAQTALKH